jgi:hypothetical protein
MRTLYLSLLLLLLFAGHSNAQQCIEFEQFTSGQMFQQGDFNPGDTIGVDHDIALVIAAFQDQMGNDVFRRLEVKSAINEGFKYAESNHLFMGGGLKLDFSVLQDEIESVFIYYKQGQGLIKNLSINGVQNNGFDYSDFPRDWTNGIQFFHQLQEGNSQGIIMITGVVNELIISGEALEIDNICFDTEVQSVVYPGDANHDGICNYLDILNIGVNFGQAGPFRRNANDNWAPQDAINWRTIGASNAKYADANGDGFITEADFDVISQLNLGQMHGLGGSDPAYVEGEDMDDFSVYFEKEGGGDTIYYSLDEPFNLSLNLVPGDLNNTIYGLSWIWKVNPDNFDVANPAFEFDFTTEFGDESVLRTILDTTRIDQGIIGCAMVRIDGNPVQITEITNVGTFNGIIVDLVGFQSSDDNGNIDIDSLRAIDQFGDPIPVFDQNRLVYFSPDSTTTISENPYASEVRIFPNPVGQKMNLDIPQAAMESVHSMRIYNTAGVMVLDKEVTSRNMTFDVGYFLDGEYFVELIFESLPRLTVPIQIKN